MDPSMPMPTDAAGIAAAFEQGAKAQLSANIGLSLGPFLLAGLIDCMFWGFMIHQALVWASTAGKDRLALKLCVAWIACISTATTFYTISYIYKLFVLGFGTFTNFTRVDALSWYGLLEILTIVAVQIFYTERAYRLNNQNILLPIIVFLCLVVSITGGIGAVVGAHHLTGYGNIPEVSTWFYMFVGATLGADLVITGSIMYGLGKSRTGWGKTDKVINKFLWISFESQLPPTIVGLLLVLLYALDSKSTLVAGCLIVHTKVYCCALFAVLNSRVNLRRDISTDHNDSSVQKGSNLWSRSSRPHQQTFQLDHIQVDTRKYEVSHTSPESKLGLNRRTTDLEDAESGISRRLDYDENSSMVGLTAVPSRG